MKKNHMKEIDSWRQLIKSKEDAGWSSLSVEPWLFSEMMREVVRELDKLQILGGLFISNSEVVKIYKRQNKKWEKLARLFPDLIHKKSFSKNIKLNMNIDINSIKWWFV